MTVWKICRDFLARIGELSPQDLGDKEPNVDRKIDLSSLKDDLRREINVCNRLFISLYVFVIVLIVFVCGIAWFERELTTLLGATSASGVGVIMGAVLLMARLVVRKGEAAQLLLLATELSSPLFVEIARIIYMGKGDNSKDDISK
jgi:hypothetical protein